MAWQLCSRGPDTYFEVLNEERFCHFRCVKKGGQAAALLALRSSSNAEALAPRLPAHRAGFLLLCDCEERVAGALVT